MPLVSDYFSAMINAKLEATDVYLPLDEAAKADLLKILADPKAYTYLTLKGEQHFETVKVINQQSTLILERAREGTKAVLHHFGTCISTVSPTVLAVIKDLVCNFDACCEGNPCPCEPVTYVGAVLPTGRVAQEWKGSAVFKGGLPMITAVNGTPTWMSVIQNQNAVFLSGTPTAAGTFSFSVAATNCNGTVIVTQPLTVTVTT